MKCVIFRTIQPERSAYLGLSEEAHEKNQKNMHVNAQVTAVTTMMEVFGNCINGIMYLAMDGLNVKFATSALFMLLHFVVLSYAFLMNTRYNKNRIIEYGWFNVIKNIFGFNNGNVIQVENGNVGKADNKKGESKVKRNDKKVKKSPVSIVSSTQNLTVKNKNKIKSNAAKGNQVQEKVQCSAELTVSCPTAANEPSISEKVHFSASQMKNSSLSSDNMKPPDVFTISDNVTLNVPNISEKVIPLASQMDQPSSVKDNIQYSEAFTLSCNTAPNMASTSEKDALPVLQIAQPVNSNANDKHSDILTVSCTAAFNSFNVHGKNILYDTQMDTPSSSTKCKDMKMLSETVQCNNDPTISQNRSRIFDRLLSSLNEENIYIFNVMKLVQLEEAFANDQNIDGLTEENVNYTIVELPHFLGNLHRRQKKRGNMISDLIEYKNDDDKYQRHFEYFIEMEENFIENGC